MHYHTVLFDLDGTLLDTKAGIFRGVKETLHALNRSVPSDEALKLFLGPPLREGFTKVCGLPEEMVEEAISIYRSLYLGREYLFECKVYDGIPELLAQLAQQGCRLGVATSKAEPLARSVLEYMHLESCFDTVCGAPLDNSAATKADSVRSALSAIEGAKAQSTVLIGDRRFDAEGAAQAGVESIGVLYGFGSGEEIRASSFTQIAATVRELGELLRR